MEGEIAFSELERKARISWIGFGKIVILINVPNQRGLTSELSALVLKTSGATPSVDYFLLHFRGS